jgi:hypothetical protein
MANLKIRIFKNGSSDPDTTVTIPLDILKLASSLMPRAAADALQEKGIDVNEILELSRNEEVKGTLVEVEEHKKNEKIVVAIE